MSKKHKYAQMKFDLYVHKDYKSTYEQRKLCLSEILVDDDQQLKNLFPEKFKDSKVIDDTDDHFTPAKDENWEEKICDI